MRVTLKLSLAIGLCILAVLSVHASLRIQADLEVARADVRRDHALLGRVLSTGVELLLERNDWERARELVSAVNARENNVQIRWITRGGSQSPLVEDAELGGETRAPHSHLTSLEGVDAIVTYVPVVGGAHDSSIEMAEPLTTERAQARNVVLRTSLTTLVLLVACMSALWVFGVVLVGRPVAQLRDHARQVGRGELSARLLETGTDEIGDLAREMNAMTAHLAEARTRADEETAARADALDRLRHADRLRAVGEMASAVAHEIGTPLAIVRARAQQLASADLGAERVREVASIVIGEVDRMTTIIRRLLAVSRRDVGAVGSIEVERWATETIALLEPLARAVQVRLELEASSEAPEVELDSGKLRQVAINLVMNAIQASPRGASVRVHASVASGSTFVLAVEDAGPGIPITERSRIFEPFFTTKSVGEGTGLGLSVAAGLVREQGGTITVGDREGGGARFEVRVPAGPKAGMRPRGSTRREIDLPD